MPKLLRFLALVMCISLGPQVFAERTPLDLPSGRSGEADEETEELDEAITFYGSDFEGDAFFWCVDKSCSMGPPGMALLAAEVTQAVQSLSARSEIGLVAFSNNVIFWRLTPQKANYHNKLSLSSYVSELSAMGGTIIGPAGVQTLDIANQSSKRKRNIIVLSDGMPTDADPISVITGANYQSIPIHTIYINLGSGDGWGFMQALAAANGGSARMVN